MAERDDELMLLKARVAELEARPSATDLDWLKNSNVWRRAQFATSPGWVRFNVTGIAVGWGLFILYATISVIR